MKQPLERLSSLSLMLIFTSAGFIVLVASVILMTVESLISPLLPQTASSKTASWKKSFTKPELSLREPQVCSRS